MKRIAALVVFILLSIGWGKSVSQNLVPNPSFEDTVYCPIDIDDFGACADWHSAGEAFWTTPNYFNTCSSFQYGSPPYATWGYQETHSGKAYCWLETYFTIAPFNRRETIQATLIQPLNIGQKYFVSFYSSCPGLGANNTATNKLGALFTTYVFTPTNFATPHNFAQVYSDSILTDTMNWFHFKDSFIADSAYEYVTIGNFFDDAHTDTVVLFTGSYYSGGYYIDDVCVSADSLSCFLEQTGINEVPLSSFSIYPNPFSTSTIITLPNYTEPFNLQLFDELGREAPLQYRTTQQSNYTTLTIDRGKLLSGMYLLSITSKEKREVVKLMVK